VSWFSRTYECEMETMVGPPTLASHQQFSFLETDGHGIASAGKFVIFITEAKSKAGSGGGDALYRSMVYWTKLYLASKDMQKHAGYSCLPAILIIYEGKRYICLECFA
jgi:hypothetical protein